MANFQIPPPDPLNLADGTAATNWRNWKAAWSNYTLATKLDKEAEERQVATLLAVIGNEANKVFRTFTWVNPDDAKKINSVLQKFEDHCIPRQNIIYERFKFFTRQQSTTETVDQYFTDLRQIAANCDWESLTPDQLLRDRIVTGIRDSSVRARLLREKKLTLEKALNHVRAVESTETQIKEMSIESSVQAVQFKPQRARAPQPGRNRSGDTSMNRGKKKNARPTAENNSRPSETLKDCKYCGRDHKKGKCPAYGQTCRNWQGINHFAAKCSAKSRVSTIQEKFHLGAARFAGQQGREMVTLTLLNAVNNDVGQEVTFLMDTRAERNVLPASVYRRVTGDESLQQLHRYGNSVLILANGYEQPIEGKATEWCWLPAHAKAVSRIKAMMITAPVLAYYNVKPVTIQCNASQSGLGAALLQDGCPVAYCSHAMTQTEQNYAQIEKELLAVVFACEKFNHYIYARKNVAVESDHKPLETIFKKPIHSSPKRVQRMRLRLQNYDLKVEYKRGTLLYLADTLSRAYLEHTSPDSDHCEVHAVRKSSFASELEQLKHHEDVSVLPRKLEAIRDATAQDEELQILIDTIKVGWPTSCSDVKKHSQRKRRVIKLYWNSREELTTEDCLVYKGHRIVIPAAERPSTIKSLHESHIGVESTL